MLSKDVDSLQPHIRAFVGRAVTLTACPECGGTRLSEAARSSKIDGINIADACAMQITDLAAWVRGLDEPSSSPLAPPSPASTSRPTSARDRGPRGHRATSALLCFQTDQESRSNGQEPQLA